MTQRGQQQITALLYAHSILRLKGLPLRHGGEKPDERASSKKEEVDHP